MGGKLPAPRPSTTLRKHFKALRKRRGTSQKRMAEILGMSQSNYSKLERAEIHADIGIDLIFTLAAYYDVDWVALIEHHDAPPPAMRPRWEPLKAYAEGLDEDGAQQFLELVTGIVKMQRARLTTARELDAPQPRLRRLPPAKK